MMIRWIAVLVMFSLCVLPATGQPALPPFVQTHIDAIFWVDAQTQTTTAAYSIGYMPADMTPVEWVFVLPPGASEIATGPSLLPVMIADFTNTTVEALPADTYCFFSPIFIFLFGYGWRQLVSLPNAAAGQPVSLTLEAAIDRLPGQREVLHQYADLGWSFVGLTLTPQPAPADGLPDELVSAVVQRSPLLMVRYPGVQPVVPLALHADDLISVDAEDYSQAERVRVQVSIFAETAYTTDALTTLATDSLSAGLNMLRTAMLINEAPIQYPDQGLRDYLSLLHTASSTTRSFILTQMGPAPDLTERERWTRQYENASALYAANLRPVLTQFDASLPPRAHTVVTFTPLPDTLPTTIERPNDGRTINPLMHWGCTTERLYDPILEVTLPPGRTRLADLGVSLAHPEDWSVSTVDGVSIVAPQAVDADDLAALERGEVTFPALVVSEQARYYTGTENPTLPGDHWIGLTTDTPIPPASIRWLYFPERITAAAEAEFGAGRAPIAAVGLGLFVPPTATAAERDTYRAMMQYAGTMQYITAPDLRHTLYLGELGSAVGIGYPQGWEVMVTQDGDRVIVLEAGRQPDDAVTLQIDRRLPLSDPPADQGIQPYAAAGRRGFVVATRVAEWPQVIISTPAERYADDADLLRHLAERVRPHQPAF